MAEICCDVVTQAERLANPCSPRPRLDRRRRMTRRFKILAGAEALDLTQEMDGKRRRLGCSRSSPGVEGAEEPRVEVVTQRASDPELTHLSPPKYGMMAVCGRRREMEDAVSIRPNFVKRACRAAARNHSFFGVYDGHGCSHVAALCRNRMHELVAEEMSRLGSDPLPPEAWTRLMERSFSLMDSEASAAAQLGSDRLIPCCRCELQTPRCDNVGSTAVVGVVGPTHIVVANCGDSRAVLCRGGVPVPLSFDHKPDRPDELSRIEAAGGRVIYWEGARVLGVLAMSRAIGDNYLKPYVTSEPEVTVTERSEEDECLILGSDGLWDVVTNDMACHVARMCLRASSPARVPGERRDGACSDAATLLTKLALARGSEDNVSVVVVDLRRQSR
ncbi:probable protein phosphatase 2C 68 [Musa acuminata AAA Group]|uniref:probable protein phosphatase 2C 68 n=1 Tax=Musa acuminata AAA Group TaxID=214697 RepID=UPI0031D0B554